MSYHVMANSGECADLFKLYVETFDLFGDATSFTRQCGAVRSPVWWTGLALAGV